MRCTGIGIGIGVGVAIGYVRCCVVLLEARGDGHFSDAQQRMMSERKTRPSSPKNSVVEIIASQFICKKCPLQIRIQNVLSVRARKGEQCTIRVAVCFEIF